VALVLGSGGARGYAHVGVLQVLEERGIEVACISGSSMGALVGAVHAAGRLDDYTDWVLGLGQLDVLRLLDLSLSAPGAIRAEKVFARVRDLLGGVRIEDLPIPYTAVATDLLSRREVWFQRGPVEVAVRASVAIPSIITPVMLNGRLLADGGILNPVPIAPTMSVQSDATIAVSLGGEARTAPDGQPEFVTAEERPVEEWAERFKRGAASLLDRDMVRALLQRFGSDAEPLVRDADRTAGRTADRDADRGAAPGVESAEGPGGHPGTDPDVPDPQVMVERSEMGAAEQVPFDVLPPGLSKLDVMQQSLDAMQSVLARYRLAGYPPDVLISVPKDACRSLDFHKAQEMIDLGRHLAIDALDAAVLPGRAP
jgi:NTE family protein